MRIIMFTRESDATDVLPATAFLDSPVECLPPMPSSYAEVDSADVVMIDARGDLTRARALCQLFTGPMDCPPIILILEEAAPPRCRSTGAPPTSSWPEPSPPSSRPDCGSCALTSRWWPRPTTTASRSETLSSMSPPTQPACAGRSWT